MSYFIRSLEAYCHNIRVRFTDLSAAMVLMKFIQEQTWPKSLAVKLKCNLKAATQYPEMHKWGQFCKLLGVNKNTQIQKIQKYKNTQIQKIYKYKNHNEKIQNHKMQSCKLLGGKPLFCASTALLCEFKLSSKLFRLSAKKGKICLFRIWKRFKGLLPSCLYFRDKA